MKDIIKRLTETYGPSGSEGKIREQIKKEIRGLADQVSTDVLGNLIAIKKGKGSRVMVAAHMDEIGFIITHIDKNGFLRFSNIGGIYPYNIIAQRVVFENGIIGTINEERSEKPTDPRRLDRMYIDIGVKDHKEASAKVSVGDVAGFHRACEFLGNRAIAKSMDDRIGCAIMIEVMKQLKKSPNQIYFVFTTQEEVGLRGATTAAFGVAPDLGIAVDITGAFDTPEEKPKLPSVLGKGTAIKIKDAGMLAHPAVKKLLVDTAKAGRIPYQFDILEGGTTDGSVINKTRSGIPTGVLSVPTRYAHSASEMVDMVDVKATVDLLVKLLSSNLKAKGF
ncbi:MAG: M42 family metallopeptidase [Candidatus Edwardsbacteria bacterium]|nr:M42 family metallopeptidase [Candidatus Edwardsbacteria bacterium]MBU1576130.1 M42 family metallopeptidase [Candidatus Edwardsbacteria bacterium]MBU2463344.1 M42 family metallopeptidase [Candidatus Edwardsbacteria bacterium]MBU2593170.1 M42 family metallopeptidase [Candidatus Edwardsbacteria bacterium]